MTPPVKAPPVYKPRHQGVAPPPVYRPQQGANSELQRRVAVPPQLEMRPAPPVYRPLPSAVTTATPALGRPGQAILQTFKGQSSYEVGQPVWVGNGRQQIKVKVKGSPAPVGTVDIHYENGKTHLSDLEVMQSHRRQGAATELVKAALASARRNGSLRTELEAHPGAGGVSTQALVGMYRKLGFKTSGSSVRGNPVMVLQQKPATGMAPVFSPYPNTVQRMKKTTTVPAWSSDKEVRRFAKAYNLMENAAFASITLPEIGKKIAQQQPIAVKVLIISEAEEESGNKKILSNHLASHFSVTPTYFPQTNINEASTFPPQQFDLVLGRNLICICDSGGTATCGGIDTSLDPALNALKTISQKLTANTKARAYLTIPLTQEPAFHENHETFWAFVMEKFNLENSNFIVVPLTYRGMFYGIKMKRRKGATVKLSSDSLYDRSVEQTAPTFSSLASSSSGPVKLSEGDLFDI